MKKNAIKLYKIILKENESFKNLFYAFSISSLGDWFYSVALMSLLYRLTDSALTISSILLASSVPRLLLSPFAGALIDKLNKKKVMVISDFIRAILIILVVPFAENIPIIFIITILNSIASIFFAPARQSLIPLIVKKKQLAASNTMTSTVSGLMSILGASLGGLISTIFSYKTAFFINGVSFAISAILVLITSLPTLASANNNVNQVSYFRSIIDGYKFIFESKIINALIITGISWGFVGGAYQVLIVVYGSDVFAAGDTGIGALYTTQGLGTLIGSLLVAQFFSENIKSMKKVFGWAYLMQGLFFIFFVLSNHIYLGIIFLLVMRIAGGIIMPLSTTLIQTYTPPDVMGRVFTFYNASYSALMQLSMFATGLLLEWKSPRFVGLTFGILCLIVSFYWLVLFYKNKLDVNISKENIIANDK